MTIEEQILQYVVELGPAISAILTIICSLLVSIKKFGAIKKDTLTKLQDLAKEISDENNVVLLNNTKIPSKYAHTTLTKFALERLISKFSIK